MFSLHFAGTLVWGTKAPRFRLCMNIAKPSYHPLALEQPLLRPKLWWSFLRFWVCLFCCSKRSSLQLFLQLSKKKNVFFLFFRLVNVQLVLLGFWGCFKLLVLGTLLGRVWSFTVKLKRWLVFDFFLDDVLCYYVNAFWRMRIWWDKTVGKKIS